MKIVAIDAGRGNYALNRALLTVVEAAEDAGADLTYLRLSDYRIMNCLNCKLCVLGDGCKLTDDLPRLIEPIKQANGIIIGTPDNCTRSSKTLQALLTRLSPFFDSSESIQPSLPGFGSPNSYLSKRARDAKRAIIVTSAINGSGISSYFTPIAAQSAQVRRISRLLDSCNIDAVGSMSLRRGNVKNDELCIDSYARAVSMGRLIMGKL